MVTILDCISCKKGIIRNGEVYLVVNLVNTNSENLRRQTMTNEEIKKKIVEVLKETINWATDYSIPIGIVYKSELEM